MVDVLMNDKESKCKMDKVDSWKIVKGLKNGEFNVIFIFDEC